MKTAVIHYSEKNEMKHLKLKCVDTKMSEKVKVQRCLSVLIQL